MRRPLPLVVAVLPALVITGCFVPDHEALGAKLVDECRVIPGVIPSCACTGNDYADAPCRAAADFTFDEALDDSGEQDCVLAHTCEETGDPDDVAALRECVTRSGSHGAPPDADPACLGDCVATMESCANTGCTADNVLFCMRDHRACEQQCD